MFVKIENFLIPCHSILFIEKVRKSEPVTEGEGDQNKHSILFLEINFTNGRILSFEESEETKLLEEKIGLKDKPENKAVSYTHLRAHET